MIAGTVESRLMLRAKAAIPCTTTSIHWRKMSSRGLFKMRIHSLSKQELGILKKTQMMLYLSNVKSKRELKQHRTKKSHAKKWQEANIMCPITLFTQTNTILSTLKSLKRDLQMVVPKSCHNLSRGTGTKTYRPPLSVISKLRQMWVNFQGNWARTKTLS